MTIDDWSVASQTATLLRKLTFRMPFSSLLNKLNLPHIRFHDLRHFSRNKHA